MQQQLTVSQLDSYQSILWEVYSERRKVGIPEETSDQKIAGSPQGHQ